MRRENQKFYRFLQALSQLQTLFLLPYPPQNITNPYHVILVYLLLVLLMHCNRDWLLLLMDNLHDHLKSPQDPYVVVVLGSLCLSSVYRMPFHLAARRSGTVNSLIAG